MITGKPTPPAEVLYEQKLSVEQGEFEVGLIRVNHDRQPVAYAELGKTTVAISRGADGKVRIEVDDTADEPVYVSINASTVVTAYGPERPWND